MIKKLDEWLFENEFKYVNLYDFIKDHDNIEELSDDDRMDHYFKMYIDKYLGSDVVKITAETNYYDLNPKYVKTELINTHRSEDTNAQLFLVKLPFIMLRIKEDFENPAASWETRYILINKEDISKLELMLSYSKADPEITPQQIHNRLEKDLNDFEWIKKNVPPDNYEKLSVSDAMKEKLKSRVAKNKFDL